MINVFKSSPFVLSKVEGLLMRFSAALLVPSQSRIGERGVLAGRGLVDSFFEGVFRRPFFGRARCAIPIHFVEPPEDFEGMAVGIAKLDRYLGAGASPAVKIDRHAVFLEIIPGAKHVVDGRDFEREMMQFTLPGDFSALAHETEAVMVVVETHKNH